MITNPHPGGAASIGPAPVPGRARTRPERARGRGAVPFRQSLGGQLLILSACLAVTAACVWWIHRTQFSAPKFNVVLHQAVGRALADQAVRIMGGTGKVVVVSIDLAGVPELKTQLAAFEDALRLHPGVQIKQRYFLDADEKPKYSFGTGLSGRRFVRLVNKNPTADVIVSFIGAPGLTADELAQLKKTPPFVAEARSADKLKRLFDQKILHAAVVSRFQFPTPIKGTPHTPQEWFDQRFQVVTADQLAALPGGKEE